MRSMEAVPESLEKYSNEVLKRSDDVGSGPGSPSCLWYGGDGWSNTQAQLHILLLTPFNCKEK